MLSVSRSVPLALVVAFGSALGTVITAQQAPASHEVPPPRAIEDALTLERGSRNPTFVEYQEGTAGRTLVVGVPYSPRALDADLTDDFETLCTVLVRRQWIQHFVALQLVVPQPLVRVTSTIDHVRQFHEKRITKAEFQKGWQTDKRGPS